MTTLPDQQALDFLVRLFPGGLGDAGVLAEICPDGWENSPLRLAYHPGPERRYEEHCGHLETMVRLRPSAEIGKPVPTYDEFLATEQDDGRFVGGPLEEWTQLLGDCLWDVLSNGHDLILASGERVNFGSFRTVSALIDGFIEGVPLSEDWDWGDCMRFYMGTSFVGGRTDLGPLYRVIFNKLWMRMRSRPCGRPGMRLLLRPSKPIRRSLAKIHPAGHPVPAILKDFNFEI